MSKARTFPGRSLIRAHHGWRAHIRACRGGSFSIFYDLFCRLFIRLLRFNRLTFRRIVLDFCPMPVVEVPALSAALAFPYCVGAFTNFLIPIDYSASPRCL
jgi:hypothetical protein